MDPDKSENRDPFYDIRINIMLLPTKIEGEKGDTMVYNRVVWKKKTTKLGHISCRLPKRVQSSTENRARIYASRTNEWCHAPGH